MIYLVVLLLLLYGLRYDFSIRSKSADNYYIFECMTLVLLMGLRYHVGGDSIRYESYFEYSSDLKDIIANGISYGGFQPLWIILQGISKTIIDDFVFFQFVHCSIVISCIFYLANKHSRHRFTFVALFYFLYYPYFCTEIMRESLSVVFFMFGIDYLVEKKYIKYLFICLVAFLFHASAIFLFAIPFIFSFLSKPSSFRQVLLITVMIIVVSYMFKSILGFFSDTIFSENQLLENKLEDLSSSTNLNIFGILATIIGYFCVFFTYKYLKSSSLSTPYAHFVVSMYLMTVILSMVYIPLSRLQNYFVLPFLYIFADLLYDSRLIRKYNLMLKLSLVLLLYSRFSYYVSDIKTENAYLEQIKFYQLYYPYHSVLNPEIVSERELFIENQF